jgi:hypothetical protein
MSRADAVEHPTGKPLEYRTPLEIRFWEKADIQGPDECWEWTAAKTKDGYGAFKLGGVTRRAHRVAVMLDLGLTKYENVPGEVVKHECDNPGCVNPKHLTPSTQTENLLDRYNRGSERALTADEVREIRARRDEGEMHREIAEDYPVSQSLIEDITIGEAYAWVE